MWGPSLLFTSSRYNVHSPLSNPRHFSQLGGRRGFELLNSTQNSQDAIFN